LIFFAKVEFIIKFLVFEITPKEQLLKNIRKGLVQPLPNKYPLLNFEKDILKKTVLLKDEDFVKSWVDKGFFFHTFKGMYDLLHQISDLNAKYQLGVPVIEEQNLIELFQEIKLPYLTIDKPGKTIFSSFSRLESTTNSILLSSELQPIKHFKMFENIILFGKSSLIESPATNRYFSEIILKNELRIQLNIDFFSSFKFVFLFIDEQG